MTNTIWACIVGALVLGIIIYACKQNVAFRIGVITILCIALPAGAAWCWIQLNTYYNAEGGIIGHLTGIYNPNEIEVVDELNYTVKNIELKQAVDSSDTYSAKVIVNEVFEYDSAKNYTITINESPCFSATRTDDGVIATYSYNFYNEKYEFLMNSDLTISIAFYDTHTNFIFTTDDGEQAVKNWNAYFNTHTVVMALKETDFEKDFNLSYGEGLAPEVEQYSVQFYVEDTLLEDREVLSGTSLGVLPKRIDINSWVAQIDGEVVTITEDFKLNSDLVVTAVCDYSDLSYKSAQGGLGTFCYKGSQVQGKDGLVYVENRKHYYYDKGYCWDTYSFSENLDNERKYVIISSSNENCPGFICFSFETKQFSYINASGYGWGTPYFNSDSETVLLTSSYISEYFIEFYPDTNQYMIQKQEEIG